MKKQVNAILWRKCNQATADTLRGVSTGQYHIALSTVDFTGFFNGLAQANPTALGGFDVAVQIQGLDGTNPVPAETLTFRFMGQDSARRDWNIRAQRPATAYPLWRPGRGIAAAGSFGSTEYIFIARDVSGDFHARWITDQDFSKLPAEVAVLLRSSETGWNSL